MGEQIAKQSSEDRTDGNKSWKVLSTIPTVMAGFGLYRMQILRLNVSVREELVL